MPIWTVAVGGMGVAVGAPSGVLLAVGVDVGGGVLVGGTVGVTVIGVPDTTTQPVRLGAGMYGAGVLDGASVGKREREGTGTARPEVKKLQPAINTTIMASTPARDTKMPDTFLVGLRDLPLGFSST